MCFIGPGAYAKYTAAPALHSVKVPDRVNDRLAAGAYMQGLAATALVFETCQINPGQRALVHAAAGGVGLWLCQLLARKQVRVIATTSTADKRAMALDHGAEVALAYEKDDIVNRVQDVTHGTGVDVVFDGVGKATLETNLAGLQRKGTLVMHGTASGDPGKDFRISCLTPKNIRFLKQTVMNYLASRDEVDSYAGQVFDALASESVSVRISKEYALQDAGQAHQVSA